MLPHVRVVVLVVGAREAADAALVPGVVRVRRGRVLLQLRHNLRRKLAQVTPENSPFVVKVYFRLKIKQRLGSKFLSTNVEAKRNQTNTHCCNSRTFYRDTFF